MTFFSKLAAVTVAVVVLSADAEGKNNAKDMMDQMVPMPAVETPILNGKLAEGMDRYGDRIAPVYGAPRMQAQGASVDTSSKAATAGQAMPGGGLPDNFEMKMDGDADMKMSAYGGVPRPGMFGGMGGAMGGYMAVPPPPMYGAGMGPMMGAGMHPGMMGMHPAAGLHPGMLGLSPHLMAQPGVVHPMMAAQYMRNPMMGANMGMMGPGAMMGMGMHPGMPMGMHPAAAMGMMGGVPGPNMGGFPPNAAMMNMPGMFGSSMMGYGMWGVPPPANGMMGMGAAGGAAPAFKETGEIALKSRDAKADDKAAEKATSFLETQEMPMRSVN